MSPELLNAIASLGTLIVVAFTAIAALRQLETLHNSNQVTALATMTERWDSERIRGSLRFLAHDIAERLADPAFRAQVGATPVGDEARAVLPVLNFFENLGLYVKLGILSERAALSFYSWVVLEVWDQAAPAIAIMRRTAPGMENFEYLAMRARRYIEKLPGTDDYPPGIPRMPLEDVWLAEDRRIGAMPPLAG